MQHLLCYTFCINEEKWCNRQMSSWEINPIGYIHTDFSEKFGIPRQSGMVDSLLGRVVLETEYRRAEAFREIEGFSHLWLVWQFSQSLCEKFSPTVRPPRLGGNRRVGVFASRSPFRPNGLGLSCVRLVSVDYESEDAPALIVAGIDMLDGTPIFDIKPYIPMSDCHPEASEGYTAQTRTHRLNVEFPAPLLERIAQDKRESLTQLLASDPRPGYDDSAEKQYGLSFDGANIRFTVENGTLIVYEVER